MICKPKPSRNKIVFWWFFSEKGVQGLSGLRNLLKGESALFERNIFRIQKWWQSSMSIPPCRAHPTCFMLLPLPPLGLTSFASWYGVSMSWLLILQDSDNFSSFICSRLAFLAGSPYLWVSHSHVSPTLHPAVQQWHRPGVWSHIQTQPPTPQVPGDTYRV